MLADAIGVLDAYDLAASLLTLEGAGHGVERADWKPLGHAIVEHTAAADRGGQWPSGPS